MSEQKMVTEREAAQRELHRLHDRMLKAGTYHDDHPDSYGAMCDAEAASDDFWRAVAALVEADA